MGGQLTLSATSLQHPVFPHRRLAASLSLASQTPPSSTVITLMLLFLSCFGRYPLSLSGAFFLE